MGLSWRKPGKGEWMKIFLSYASEDAVAEEIQIRLAADGHDLFFDRQCRNPTA
jgi:hypothetical protein